MATQAADLVVTDLTMPGRSGLDFIKDLQAAYPSLPILVVSMHDEMVYAERALRAGARGYIMKEAGGEALLGAVRQILSGQAYVSPRMAAKLVESATSRQPRGATNPMERFDRPGVRGVPPDRRRQDDARDRRATQPEHQNGRRAPQPFEGEAGTRGFDAIDQARRELHAAQGQG